MKGDSPPGSGLWLERNGGGKRGAVFPPGESKKPGMGRAVRAGGVLVRHKLLPDLVGASHEQDLQRVTDEFIRFPLEQRNADGLCCYDEAGLVNRHGAPALFKLRRGVAGGLARSRRSEIGQWFRQGRHSKAGTLVLA